MKYFALEYEPQLVIKKETVTLTQEEAEEYKAYLIKKKKTQSLDSNIVTAWVSYSRSPSAKRSEGWFDPARLPSFETKMVQKLPYLLDEKFHGIKIDSTANFEVCSVFKSSYEEALEQAKDNLSILINMLIAINLQFAFFIPQLPCSKHLNILCDNAKETVEVYINWFNTGYKIIPKKSSLYYPQRMHIFIPYWWSPTKEELTNPPLFEGLIKPPAWDSLLGYHNGNGYWCSVRELV